MAVFVEAKDLVVDRERTCCFTGHRNRDLPFNGDLSTQGMRNLLSIVHFHIIEAYEAGSRNFMTGMAEGVDLLCGSVMFDVMNDKRYPNIKLYCVLPYAEQRRELNSVKDRYIHSLLMQCAEAVVVTGNACDKGRYRVRNQFMVDHSSRMIAVYKEKPAGSGTLQTINMARRAGLDMHIIRLDERDNSHFYVE